jgi:hypothetical protein
LIYRERQTIAAARQRSIKLGEIRKKKTKKNIKDFEYGAILGNESIYYKPHFVPGNIRRHLFKVQREAFIFIQQRV